MKFDHRFSLRFAGQSHRVYEADGVTVRLDFFAHMLRVAVLKADVPLIPTWSVCPQGADMPLSGRDRLSRSGFELVAPKIAEADGVLSFAIDGVDFSIELKNFRISASTEKGLLYRDRSGLSYNFAGELGQGSVHYVDRFENEQIFGLGDKCGHVNKANERFLLHAGDAMGFRAESSDPLYKHLPFMLCRHGAGSYGLFYDTLSSGAVDLGREHDNYFEPFRSVRFEEENLVFYLILGTPMEIVRRFSALTGTAAPVPRWAFSYCGSTMAYTDAPDADRRLRGFVTKCEENGIPCRGFYLSSGYTEMDGRRSVFHWNRDKIPSPEGLSAHFKAHGMVLIPNVKPAFLTDHPLFETIARNGWFLKYADGSPALFPFWGGMAAYLDFTDPGAYDFWKACVRTELIDRGYTDIWNDNNEYDVWDEDVLCCGFGSPLPAARIRPLFSYLMARASREASVEAGVETPFNVSRCAMAGTQRVASTWTGDNLTDFRDLRFNHYQAMTMALSGFLFFGPDIGGFAGPSPGRELFLRWLQYGVFLPRFVLHSWKPEAEPTMPWLYEDLLPAVRRLFELREKLVPYLCEQAEACRKKHEPLLRPVFLLDGDYPVESDFFLCGEDMLVCPVFDEGAANVALTLPKGSGGWRLRGEGPTYPPGDELIVPCLPEDDPVWFTKEKTAR